MTIYTENAFSIRNILLISNTLIIATLANHKILESMRRTRSFGAMPKPCSDFHLYTESRNAVSCHDAVHHDMKPYSRRCLIVFKVPSVF